MNLKQTLQNQVLSNLTQFGEQNLIVAQKSWDDFQSIRDIPAGVSLSHKPLKSRRVAARGRRLYGDVALVEANWLKDGLHAIRAPKICFVISGNVAFQVADTLIHCKSGHTILIPPGIAHPDGSQNYLDDSKSNDGNCELLMMMPHVSGVECWLSYTQHSHHWSHRSAQNCARMLHPKLPEYIESLLHEAISPQQYTQQLCRALLLTIVLLTLRELQNSSSDKEQTVSLGSFQSQFPQSDNPIDSIQSYINQHLHEKLTLEMAARNVYMSRSNFIKLFRETTGKSFNSYVSDCRLQKAQKLLSDKTNWPIERIAGFVGLGTGRLRALFHQRLGMSPTAYRISQKKP